MNRNRVFILSFVVGLVSASSLGATTGHAEDANDAAFATGASQAYLDSIDLKTKAEYNRQLQRNDSTSGREWYTSIEDNIDPNAGMLVDTNSVLTKILASAPARKVDEQTIAALRAVDRNLPKDQGGGRFSGELIHRIRDRAEHICGSDGGSNPPDPQFYGVRVHIHNYFSPEVLDETRQYLRDNPGISPEAKREIRLLISDLETLLGVNIPSRQQQLQKNQAIPVLLTNVAKARAALLASQDPVGNASLMNQSLADLFVQLGNPKALPPAKGPLPVESLKVVIKALHAEGLLKDKELAEFLEEVRRVPPEVRTKDGILRDFLKHVFAVAQERLEKNLAWARPASQTDENHSTFVQEWIRSSNLLRLSQWIEKLTPKGAHYEAASQGSRCGTLRVVESEDQLNRMATGMQDILAVISTKPIEVTRKTPFGGLISTSPMTEGSHAVILCRNMQRPCGSAVLSQAEATRIKGLNGQNVRLDVGQNGYLLQKAAAIPEGTASAKQDRIALEKDLAPTEIQDRTSGVDAKSIGVKAANYFKLSRFLGNGRTQPGVAIPFSYYVDFMKASGADVLVEELLKDPRTYSDSAFRSHMLAKVREQIKKSRAPIDLVYLLRSEAEKRFAGKEGVLKRMRFRSSSNSEDLKWFSGAGMYESVGMTTKKTDTPREIDAKIGESIKAIWASVWSDSAFVGREEVGIDHSTVAMGILVHPSYSNEDANGVALTGSDPKNPDRYKVSANFGDLSVTNPEKGALPDVYEGDRAAQILEGKPDPRTFSRRSNVKYDTPVLDAREADDLRKMVKRVHEYFGEPTEIEWKLVHDPNFPNQRFIQVKQARPYRPKGRG